MITGLPHWMKRIILFACLLLSLDSLAQDPHFSQFYANPIYLNPAFAGSVRCPRIVTSYRNQWPGIYGNYNTMAVSFDRHVDDLGGGIGLMAYRDQAGSGSLTTTSFSGMYSYQVNVNRNFSIRAGLQMTYAQRQLGKDLTFPDQIDPKYGFIFPTGEAIPRSTRDYVDFSAGIIGFGKNFFGGFSVHHLAQPDESFIRTASSPLPRKYTAHAGAVLPLGDDEDFNISPNIIYQMQGRYQQLNLGLYFTKGPFVGGLWYRNNDAIITLLGFHYGIFKFGYSYDITISRLRGGLGAHELTGIFQFYCKKKRRVFNTVNCPTF
jgi:type IX secretion system PorP/SprF family membrane protein